MPPGEILLRPVQPSGLGSRRQDAQPPPRALPPGRATADGRRGSRRDPGAPHGALCRRWSPRARPGVPMGGRRRLRREVANLHRFSGRPASGAYNARRGDIREFVPRRLVRSEADGAGAACPMPVFAGPGATRAPRTGGQMRTKRALHSRAVGDQGAARARRRTSRRAACYACHCILPRTVHPGRADERVEDCIRPHARTARAATRRRTGMPVGSAFSACLDTGIRRHPPPATRAALPGSRRGAAGRHARRPLPARFPRDVFHDALPAPPALPREGDSANRWRSRLLLGLLRPPPSGAPAISRSRAHHSTSALLAVPRPRWRGCHPASYSVD